MTRTGAPKSLCWVDLGTPDVARSEDFYRAVFGWTYDELATDEGSYITALDDGRPVAGMMQQSADQPMPSRWSVFFAVTDLDRDVARVAEAGGTIVQEPFEIPGGERLAVVSDPVGAVFALATFTEVGAGVLLWDEPGAACWVECQTRSVPESIRFYEYLFGWECRATGDYVVFELDGEPVAGLMAMPEGIPAELSAHWFTYWRVDDLAAATTSVEEAGGTAVTDAVTFDEGRFTVVEDPAGAALGLFEAAPQGEAP